MLVVMTTPVAWGCIGLPPKETSVALRLTNKVDKSDIPTALLLTWQRTERWGTDLILGGPSPARPDQLDWVTVKEVCSGQTLKQRGHYSFFAILPPFVIHKERHLAYKVICKGYRMHTVRDSELVAARSAEEFTVKLDPIAPNYYSAKDALDEISRLLRGDRVSLLAQADKRLLLLHTREYIEDIRDVATRHRYAGARAILFEAEELGRDAERLLAAGEPSGPNDR